MCSHCSWKIGVCISKVHLYELAFAGCGPTCLSMVYVYFTHDLNGTPREIASYCEKNGYYTENGTSWSLWTEGLPALGLSGKDVRKVLMQLINGTFAPGDLELFRPLYNSLLNTQCTANADTYFILKDFKSYAEAQKRVEAAYRDEDNWAKSAILNVACSGKFTSDRTIQQYVDEIWHLDKVTIEE